ncbi:hypothetical protein FF38_12744 [Lucilia cuprina]|uniref:Lateral signaling target protein 2 homolog n=1 Tax=Lucilia cuprina TaxID=7375 RepID=A0A0L0CH64_LUCCU|nr:lateral signaling target protein 2 homolog [Lucilia cuprina]KAI8130581.1 Lateral signaling target protein 2 like protein [Lucilia cuprina]KNC31542.1 hypothetical protein FF38_12744 [Lucilia cuprina]
METLLKWLNKPKADDKSLLARFFHADRALAAVASELDSFDGRAEPDRCSRLVSRLRQGQDKVLAITNLIIEELLGDERDQRAFRAKFPEEVLQENLAGQLWFGAECLAAGSSIMNREQESKEMRPLAEAVTRSLNNVRYLLRDQCLRNNVPNSERLNLDKNDAATEQLYESLKRFDRLFAEFEWRYVSAMVQVKSKEEYEMQEMICVLCSETLQRALKLGLLEQDKVDAFDPALMFSIPRLAIVSGLVIYPNGPLNMDMPAEQLSEMFRPFRAILLKVRDYLRNLNETELYYLERLLCTNEEISLKDTLNSKDTGSVSADNNNTKSSKYSENSPQENVENAGSLKTNTTTSKLQHKSSSTSMSSTSCKTFKTKPTRRADSPSPAPSTTSSSSSDECSTYNTPVSSTPSSPRSSHSLVSTTSAGNESNGTTSPDSWIDDDEDDDEDGERDKDNFLSAHHDDDDHYADDDDSDINGDDESHDKSENDSNVEDDDEEETNHFNLDNVVEGIMNLESMVDQIINLEMASADCATGYLISNTTLGNLLQPQEVPLTDNFIVSDSDLPTNEDCNDNMDVELPSTSAKALNTTSRQEQQKIEKENHVNNNSATSNTTSSLRLQDSEEISISQQSSINNPSSTATTTSSSCTRRRRYSIDPQQQQTVSQNQTQQVCTKDHTRSHRHHHRHHHHHHHHNHHIHSTNNRSSSSQQHNQSHHRHRVHHVHAHGHGHHHRRPHRHGGDKQYTNGCDECVGNAGGNSATKEDSTMENSKATSSIGVLDIETPSSSSSLLEDNKSTVRASGRTKFKNKENLLHRLFVCIAGVADQLQTNFAFDLRQILRSVFLMNMSPAQEELDIPEKPKDNELFEFRASENDVIQESAGSSQSIYSAEEVNPEGDNQSNSSNSSNGSSNSNTSSSSNEGNRAYRHSTGTAITSNTITNEETAAAVANQRQQIERSRSLDNQACPTTINSQQRQQQLRQQQHNHIFRNRYNSTGSNSPSISSSENSSPVCERSTNTTNRRVSESNANMTQQQQQQQQQLNSPSPVHLSPPAWIPDQKAPRCMSCNTPFTAFRRRHHCRNCGGVFCGVCSNNSTPLPKYGLTKAVRVCRSCYVHELSSNAITTTTTSALNHQQNHHHHNNHHSQLVSQTTTTNNTNNEPRLRRPVTTTRAID